MIDKIKSFSGIKNPSEDLNISESNYTQLIEDYIEATHDWLNNYTRTNTALTDYAPGLEQILITIVANILRNHSIRQDTPILDTENYSRTEYVEQEITEDIKTRLKPYIARPKIKVWTV